MADKYNLKEMLSYMRPEGSRSQEKFCNRYLRPVFGTPDLFGNYTRIIGDKPNIAFMAHHDTVHKFSGKQAVQEKEGFFTVEGAISNCLGADCTTGVYIILKMIEAKVPGVYVVHAAEEVGCIGSAGVVASKANWIDHVDIAISFDRMGYSSIITHQLGIRTCSDAFADSLCNLLGNNYKKDTGGVYTDSNEYRGVIAECTNISVGYFSQHTSKERQSVSFVENLVDTLIKADWSLLDISRDPTEPEEDLYKDYRYYAKNEYDDYFEGVGKNYFQQETKKKRDSEYLLRDMMDIIKENPFEIALMLQDLGYDAYDLIDEVCSNSNRKIEDEIAF